VIVLGVIAGGIEVGEEGLEFFVKQGFDAVARGDGGHRTSVSKDLQHDNKPMPNFYAPAAEKLLLTYFGKFCINHQIGSCFPSPPAFRSPLFF
jgi:hypothetical protein